MTLDVDSSVCNECHEETAAQWHDTTHAQAERPMHRLPQGALADAAPDRRRALRHLPQGPGAGRVPHAHTGIGAVSCVECHMAAPGTPAVPIPPWRRWQRPSTISSTSRRSSAWTVTRKKSSPAPLAAATQLAAATPSQTENTTPLAADLDTATQRNQFLLLLGPVLLGVGVGGGGILGIVFMLVAGRLESRKRDATASLPPGR